MIRVVPILGIGTITGGYSLLYGIEQAKVFRSTIDGDVRTVLIPRLHKANAYVSCSRVGLFGHVPVVICLDYSTQIVPTVVMLDVIDMVYVLWPVALFHHEYNSMGKVRFPSYVYT
jgi:hypothetical protein